MAVINKKLIHFNTKSQADTAYYESGINSKIYFLPNNKDTAFSQLLESQLGTKLGIKWTSIVFIKDTQQIWTHGQYYDCTDYSYTIQTLDGVVSNLESTVDSHGLDITNLFSMVDTVNGKVERGLSNLQSDVDDAAEAAAGAHTRIDECNTNLQKQVDTVSSDTSRNTASINTLNTKVSNLETNKATIWKGTQAQYNALASKNDNTIYIIT